MKLIDRLDLVCVVISFPVLVSRVVLPGFQSVLLQGLITFLTCAGRLNFTDVLDAAMRCHAVESYALDRAVEPVFAKFVVLGAVNNLLHIWFAHC